jgi:pimeloyl-ACP methyl ester carboxylesterase
MAASAEPALAEGYAEANGLRIYYRQAGEGPPLVLVHGGLATGEIMWSGTVVAELAREHRVLMPDSRGHGRTDNPSGIMRYDRMADDVAAFSAALGLERPAVLGYSDGAQVALEIGLRHPGLASALVLGGVVTGLSESYRGFLGEIGFPVAGAADPAEVERGLGDYWPMVRSAHQHVYGPGYLSEFLRQTSELWYSVPTYTDEQLAAIGTPSLVIAGDRDVAALGDAVRLFRLLPRGELAVIPNADHGAGASPLFWPSVRDFLARHAESPSTQTRDA